MHLKRLLISIMFAVGLFIIPTSLFATNGTIDPANNMSRLCTNSDCSQYTVVYWTTTDGTPVTVTDSALTGYIWSAELGWINLNPTSGGVTNTTSGVLGGYGWGSTASWVNFAPTNGGVTINTTTGQFLGYAWVSGGGWMHFDCSLTGPGGVHDACVTTTWRPGAGTTGTATTTGGTGGGHPSCADPAATNFGGALPCTYATTTSTTSGTTTTADTTGTTATTGTTTGGTATGTTTSGTTAGTATSSGTTTGGATTGGVTTGTTTSGTTGGGIATSGGTTGDTTTGGGSIGFGTTSGGTTTTGGSTTTSSGTTAGGGTTTGGGTTGGGTTGGTTTGGGSTGGGGSVCIDDTSGTGVIGTIVGQVEETYCQTVQTIDKTWATIGGIIKTKNGNFWATLIATGGVIVGAALTISTSLFLNPLSFSEIFLIPARLWSLLMAAFGLKKRRRPWGTVYDSITKQPLDPVYVTLRTMEGTEVTSCITDLDGRFGFVVPQTGHYTIFAQKTNYLFPSQQLVGRDHDELYRDLYFGEHFYVAKAGDVVIKNIPMDPEKFDWNEFAKREQRLMKFYSKRDKVLRRLSNTLFVIGFIVATIAVLAAPKTYNIVIFALYIILFFIREHGTHSRPYGDIFDADTEVPISFAIIRISSASTGVEVMHRIADAKGRYYALLPNGEYKVRIDRKLLDGTYQTIAKDLSASVTKGYLSKTFKIDVSQLPMISVPPVPPSNPPTPPIPPAKPTPPVPPTPPVTPPPAAARFVPPVTPKPVPAPIPAPVATPISIPIQTPTSAPVSIPTPVVPHQTFVPPMPIYVAPTPQPVVAPNPAPKPIAPEPFIPPRVSASPVVSKPIMPVMPPVVHVAPKPVAPTVPIMPAAPAVSAASQPRNNPIPIPTAPQPVSEPAVRLQVKSNPPSPVLPKAGVSVSVQSYTPAKPATPQTPSPAEASVSAPESVYEIRRRLDANKEAGSDLHF